MNISGTYSKVLSVRACYLLKFHVVFSNQHQLGYTLQGVIMKCEQVLTLLTKLIKGRGLTKFDVA